MSKLKPLSLLNILENRWSNSFKFEEFIASLSDINFVSSSEVIRTGTSVVIFVPGFRILF